MSKPLKAFLFNLVLFLGALSCSEDVKPTPYEYTRIFTGENSNKTWKIKLLEETLDGSIVSRSLPSCLTDDRFVFYANAEHGFIATSGTRKCYSEPEADVISDTWSFNNASATLNMVVIFLAEANLPYIVLEADEEDMKVEIFYGKNNTQSYRVHFEAVDEE